MTTQEARSLSMRNQQSPEGKIVHKQVLHFQSVAYQKARLQLIQILTLVALVVMACATGAQAELQPTQFAAGNRAVLILPASLHLIAPTNLAPDSVDGLEVSWETVAGPGTVRFDPQDAIVTTVSFSEVGHYVLHFEASNGRELESGDVEVRVVSQGSVMFVSPDGSNWRNGRNINAPIRTIARAASMVKPGDLVLLRDGTYYEYNVRDAWITSGEPGLPIIFMSFPGERAIIDGSKVQRSPTSTNPSAPELIRVWHHDWYVFEDLVFRYSVGRGLSIAGDHNVVRNVVSHGNHGDGIYIRGSHNLIENVQSFDNFSVSNGGDSADGIKMIEGDGNVIRYFLAYNNSDDGIDVWDTTNTLIEYSIAHHNGRGETGNGMGFKLSSQGVESGNIVRFNVAYSNRADNFTDNAGGNLFVYNNTSWSAGHFGFVFRGRNGLKASELTNNISFAEGQGLLLDVQTKGGEPARTTTNSWDLGIEDPLFITLNVDDASFLRLSKDSPARNAGTDVGFAYSGTAMDLGAFQY